MPEAPLHKKLVWLSGEIRTPPLSKAGRIEAGKLLRRLQRGELLSFPHSRPMPVVGRQCHELRVLDEAGSWRVMYRLEPDAVGYPRGVSQDHTDDTAAGACQPSAALASV